jgi:hypothetical protein
MNHVLSLLPVPGDELLASGDSPCAIQRIQADSTVMTVAKLDYDEARSLTPLGPDSVGVLVVGTPSIGRSASALLTGPSSGPFTELWVCPDSLALDLVAGSAGAVVVGGWPGRVHWVSDGDTYRRLTQIEKDQILCAARSGPRLYLGAGSPACLYWLDDRRVTVGTWRSPVVDGGTVARWGCAAGMGGGGDLDLRARTGNLGDPGVGWSAWFAGKASDGEWTIAMPAARFAQFEVTLRSGDGPPAPLQWLQINYQARNRAPAITSFNLLARGQKPPGVIGRSSPSPSRPGGAESVDDDGDRYLVWTSSDLDDDPLEFAVSFGAYPSGEWIELGKTSDSHQVVSQGALAEGWYRFRLVATDAPGNPSALARQASAVIGPHMIDDTPPVLSDASWKEVGEGFALKADVQDWGSGVARAVVSIDGRNWMVMEPADGVADSRSESFLASLTAPIVSACVRLEDREGNSITVSVPPPR